MLECDALGYDYQLVEVTGFYFLVHNIRTNSFDANTIYIYT